MDLKVRVLGAIIVCVGCLLDNCQAFVTTRSNHSILVEGNGNMFVCQPRLAVAKLNTCEPRVYTLGGRCAEDYQCLIPNVTSKCVDNKCVVCAESSHDSYKDCRNLAVLAVSCSIFKVCDIPDSTCSVEVCKCRAGFIATRVRKNRCLPKARRLLDSCEENVQCSSTPVPSLCRSNKCRACAEATYPYDQFLKCNENNNTCAYHEFNNKCWKSRDLGQSCFNPEECWSHLTAPSTRLCNFDRCMCNKEAGYQQYDKVTPGGDKCLNSTQIALERERARAMGNDASSYKWSYLLALIVTTHIAVGLQNRI